MSTPISKAIVATRILRTPSAFANSSRISFLSFFADEAVNILQMGFVLPRGNRHFRLPSLSTSTWRMVLQCVSGAEDNIAHADFNTVNFVV